MIVEMFCDLFFKIFSLLFGKMTLPLFPFDIQDIIKFIQMILEYGTSLVLYFIPKPLIIGCLVIVIALSSFKYIYNLVMWILKKIPALGIK